MNWRGVCTTTWMKRLCLLFLALAVASTASANDAMLRIERQIGAGFTIRAPHVAQAGDVVNVSGAVCRRAFAAAQLAFPALCRGAALPGAAYVITAGAVPLNGLRTARGR